MFVLRSKCKVRDSSSEFQVAYVADSGLPRPMQVEWDEQGNASASLRPLGGLAPGFRLMADENGTTDANADDAFELALQQLGIAYVSQPTVEMFVPQAINFDLVGGVSFSKGCYPGQEIVARSHYLGKVKRRVFQATASGDVAVTAGQDVWLAGKDNEPAGVVATSVKVNGQHHLLIELPVDDAENPNTVFRVKSEAGEAVLQVTPPPYDVHQKGSVFDPV
jgi:folate-binding protein YgfZ